MCAALAAKRPDRGETLIPKLKELNDAMAEHIEDGARFTAIGGQFHDEIVRGCGNHTMIAVVGSLETLWSSHLQWWAEETAARGEYPALSKRRIALSIHTKIAEAIEAGDAERARKLSARHLADTQSYFMAEDPERRIVALSPQALARRQR
jgi:DNA-binding FadR family transcriptional regulator